MGNINNNWLLKKSGYGSPEISKKTIEILNFWDENEEFRKYYKEIKCSYFEYGKKCFDNNKIGNKYSRELVEKYIKDKFKKILQLMN